MKMLFSALKDTAKDGLSQSTRNRLRPYLYMLQRAKVLARKHVVKEGGKQPDFLLLGAQKAGTTSWFDMLCQHPDIVAPRTKELAFFDRYYGHGHGWYNANFSSEKLITGEATPDYLYLDEARDRILSDLPETTKFLVVLRDPVERLVSHYFHSVRLGYEPLPLEGALAAEELRITTNAEQYAGHPWEKRSNRTAYSYFDRGLYAAQLEKWFAATSQDRFCITTMDQLFSDRNKVCADAFAHLGLPAYDMGPPSSKNRGVYSAPVAPELIASLREKYAPSIEDLEALLGIKTGWLEK